MPLDATKYQALLDILAQGLKPKCCEVLKVEWNEADGNETRYYGTQAFDELLGFETIPLRPIEPRIMGDPFRQFEINPDLRTETISVEFSDIDKEIRNKFQTFGSGVHCELFWFYPDVALLVPMWFGQLQAPDVYGWKTVRAKITNGFRSREQPIPRRPRPKECPANFGALLPDADSIRTNLCPWDRHIGGSQGLLKNGLDFFLDCAKTLAACIERFGTAGHLPFGGFNTDASATVSDQRSGYLARTKGNASELPNPIRVIFGAKTVQGNQLLLWRREVNQNNPDHGWVSMVWEVCEGPVKNIRNVRVNEKLIEQVYLNIRNGERRQAPVTGYNPGGTISNFSNTAHLFTRYGWVNANEITPSDLQMSCVVDGYREVAVFQETGPGNGLKGEYFTGLTWTTKIGERIDYQINFTNNTTEPFEGVGRTNFSVRWQGRIVPEFSETYQFRIIHDDGVKLWVDNTVVIDQLAPGPGNHTGNIALTAGVPVDIRIDFIQGDAPGIHPWECRLFWSSPSQTEQIVPNARLEHDGASGHIRQWTNDRVWGLLECYTNQRFGLAYPFSRFDIPAWLDTSKWSREVVQFTHTFPDSETLTFTETRTLFDVIMEPRAAGEVITDICRSGGISIPFQHEGQFTIRPITAATTAELTNAPVFTDRGDNVNIIWDNEPVISAAQTPNDKIVNEIKITFEDHLNDDQERPLIVDDPDQKKLAGRSLGDSHLKTIPKNYVAYGVRRVGETIKLAHRLLMFGEFDAGGTQNNLTVTFQTPQEYALPLVRFQFIKVESELLDGFLTPQSEQFEYYRVLRMKKISNGRVEIVAQGYNKDAYEAFEVVTNPNPNPPGPQEPSPGPGPTPAPCFPQPQIVGYDSETGHLIVEVIDC